MIEDILDYKKLEALIARIPNEFYPAFLGTLVSIFGYSAIEEIPEEILTKDSIAAEEKLYRYNLEEGTCGWYTALKIAANLAECEWLIKEYDNLIWYDSDVFDDMIAKKLEKIPDTSFNDFYKIVSEKLNRGLV